MVPILYFGILHPKSVILLGLCLVFVIFSPLSLSGFKMKYSIKLEDEFSYILVTIFRLVPAQDAPLRSHFLVCSKKHLYIVGIGPIRNKEL